jgi:ABC-type spermidine/putrescine transport system permease subunit II
MPIYIWDSFKAEFRPQINVLATMILVVSVIALFISSVRNREA